jgi:hypothetical protein
MTIQLISQPRKQSKMDKLRELLHKGKINVLEYDTYFLFNIEESGRKYLKSMLEWIIEEDVNPKTPTAFAWYDGRRSCWREIKLIINKVNLLLSKEVKDDRSDNDINAH